MRALIFLATTVLLLTRAPPAPAETEPWAHKAGYAVFATTFFGDGLRFNNPYRLATPLGSSAESVSRTASYVDFGIAGVTGDAAGVQHGVALRASLAVEGVRQAAMTPSYLLWRRWRGWAAYARAGVPIVVSPETTWGFEAGAGGVLFFRGGLGVAAEIVGDVFYGAGTREAATPAYPMLSAQLGLFVAYEVLPR